ncbi:MAG: DNA internalization-related competence protein ComEC/Rec2, partial [candidate division Zixibacteria bacterium]|nr:DNA internalization-related competence protein ComEC/Rec2 [candidate division Zixibacteria bacterium]
MRRPAFYALILFITGILVGSFFDLSTLLLFSILILALFFSVLLLLRKDQKSANVFIIISLILTGFFRYELLTKDFPQNHISHFLNLNRPVTITGKIQDQPDVRVTKTFLKVQAQTLSTGKKAIATSGQMMLKIKEPTFRFDYADKIKFKGFLYEPSSRRNPGAFDYKKYLSRKGIHGIVTLSRADKVQIVSKEPGGVFLSKIIIPLRKWILGVFDKTLSGNHKALLSGFLLGETRDIPKDIYDMFRDTGTVHLLVVSGSNVWLVVGIIFALLSLLRVPKIPTTIITLISIFIFANLVHNDPPVVRAGIMASVVLLGVLLYKDVQMINLVSFSALIILLFSPLFLFDVGFQLSFASVFAIVLLVPKLSEILSKYVNKSHKKLWRWVILPCLVSLSVEIILFPILAYYFNMVPMIVVVANLFIVPLASLSVVFACFTLFSATFSLTLASIFSASNWLFLHLTLKLNTFFATLPITKLTVPSPSIVTFIVYYLFIWLLLSTIAQKRKAIIFSLVIIGNVFAWNGLLFSDSHLLKLTFLDVGQGNSTLIELPNKQTFLINAGEKWGNFDSGEYVVIPFLNKGGITKIDKFILTCNDSATLNSAKSVAEEVKIEQALIPNFRGSTEGIGKDFVENMSNKLIFLDSIDKISVENPALRQAQGGEPF